MEFLYVAFFCWVFEVQPHEKSKVTFGILKISISMPFLTLFWVGGFKNFIQGTIFGEFINLVDKNLGIPLKKQFPLSFILNK